MLILIIHRTILICISRHKNVFLRVRLDFTLQLFGQRVDDLVNLLRISHSYSKFFFLGKHSVAFDEYKPFVLCLQLFTTFFSLEGRNGLVLRGATIAQVLTICRWLVVRVRREVFVLNEGQGREFTDGFIGVARSHLVVWLVLTLVIINKVKAVSFRLVRELKWSVCGQTFIFPIKRHDVSNYIFD